MPEVAGRRRRHGRCPGSRDEKEDDLEDEEDDHPVTRAHGRRRHATNPTGASGRVSQTAPDLHSRSTNVWRLLESKPEFADGMEKAAQEHERGEFRTFTRKTARPSR